MPSQDRERSEGVKQASREQLLAMLAEAAEVEHNLMCCYLYAAFTMKTDTDEGLTPNQADAVARWRKTVIAIAVEEMGHLALVSNLMAAIGGAPNFARGNFPIGKGTLPAGMTVRLGPFDMATLDHFIYLERPEGSDVADSERFGDGDDYERGPIEQSELMPVARDYETVGQFYDLIERFFEELDRRYGSEAFFVGPASHQIGPEITPLPGLMTVSTLKDAKRAIATIVEQGEGAPSSRDDSHFTRFCEIKREYEELLADDPAFRPARSAAANPVSRKPPTPEGKVWVNAPEAAKVMDYVNGLYIHMLRLLVQAFGRPGDPAEQRILINAATDLMHALTPAAEYLTTLPANDEDGCNGGMSFATTRSTAKLPMDTDLRVLEGRFAEIAAVGDDLASMSDGMARAARTLRYVSETFSTQIEGMQVGEPLGANVDDLKAEPDAAESEDVVLTFDTKRCIHARFCVTGAPETFLSNVDGPWLHPDKTEPDQLVAITQRCPSGAISVTRKDGGWQERAPEVNLLRVRENGPLAIHADLRIAGQADGYRRVLCRCGHSDAKPYCDNSHRKIGFEATGEPEEGDTTELCVRDGPLSIEPLPNGPLQVSGPLELCSGTGRNFARTQTVKLCRCGQSASKPYCDNSHVRIGFVSE